MGQLERPTRKGYKLKEWAEISYEDWKDPIQTLSRSISALCRKGTTKLILANAIYMIDIVIH